MTDLSNETIIEEPCPECGAKIKGKVKGRGSAVGNLALHRANAHGYRNPRRKKKGASDADNVTPIREFIRDTADEIGGGAGAPKREELANALGRGLGVISLAVASYAAETDPRPGLTDDDRDKITRDLSLSRASAHDVMDPIAKTIAGTQLNQKFGRPIVDNVDTVSAVCDLAVLGLRWKRYFRERNGGPYPNATPARIVDSRPMTAPVAEDLVVTETGGMAPAAQEAMSGHVVTAAEIAAMRGEPMPSTNGSYPNAAAPA